METERAIPAAGAPGYLGLDLGAGWSKGAVVDADGRARWRACLATGRDYRAASRALRECAAATPVLGAPVVTGVGRRRAGTEATRRTEVSCLARAAHHLYRGELEVVDVGARGHTAVQVSATGRVQGFLQQRRCAAGTGFFLEELAHRLALSTEQLAAHADAGNPTSELHHACGLFAVGEAVERVRDGEPLADLCRAALRAVACHLVEQGPLAEVVVLGGGVAERFPLLGPLLAEASGSRVEVPPGAGGLGALGAAFIARDTALQQTAP